VDGDALVTVRCWCHSPTWPGRRYHLAHGRVEFSLSHFDSLHPRCSHRSLLARPICSTPAPALTHAHHHHSGQGFAPPSCPHRLALICCSRHRLPMLGYRVQRPHLLPHVVHHHRPPSVLLQPRSCIQKLSRDPLVLLDLKYTTSYPPSALSMSFPFRRVALLQADCSSEHPGALQPKSGSPSTGLAPRPLHHRPPAVGRPDFAGTPPAPMVEKNSHVVRS
jgi:hypothetical protein